MRRFEVLKQVTRKMDRAAFLAFDRESRTIRFIAQLSVNRLNCSVEQLYRLKMHQSPYIVQVFDVIERAGNVYVIEEYLYGYSLGEMLRNKSLRLNQTNLPQWELELRNGLKELHALRPKPIFHGDVQPENIMITLENRAKLVDFSSLRSKSSVEGLYGCDLEKATFAQGTKGFIDPRLLLGNPYDEKADFYGLEQTMALCRQNHLNA